MHDFARQCDITTVLDQLEDLLHSEVDREDDSEHVVPDDEVNISDWETGVENLEHKTIDDIWNDYGLGSVCAVPGFNTREDPNGKIDPWSPEGVKFLADPNSDAIPFGPQWHQLLGATGMLLRKFRGRGTLLMDEVGVGKTMQVIVLQMFLIYLRSYREAHNTYPPLFSKSILIHYGFWINIRYRGVQRRGDTRPADDYRGSCFAGAAIQGRDSTIHAICPRRRGALPRKSRNAKEFLDGRVESVEAAEYSTHSTGDDNGTFIACLDSIESDVHI